MPASITLTPPDYQVILDHYRSDADPAVRLRAPIVLLLAAGHSWALIAQVLCWSSRTIDRWQKRFRQGGVASLFGQARGRPALFAARWAEVVVAWVTKLTPRGFGFLRSRWTCGVLVVLLWRCQRRDVSRETVRRWLHRADLVWRRPRPVRRRHDPRRAAILAELRDLLRELPDDETVVCADEVDVNLNPDSGFMWMRQGEQAEVVTPGDNEKNYLAGSLHWRTGALSATYGPKRDGKLVAEHLEELCRRLRRYKVSHVLLDNAKSHDCAAVRKVLERHPGRLRLYFLPKYAPECNPVERVWWHLREEITRNHQCKTLTELLELVFAWRADRKSFHVEDSVYQENEHKTNTPAAA
ncbi:MAG: IS630 family transposase [Acidobacteria bacterium]|nr:IS630 family transposase [Acidobacteriota bacterium]